MAITKAQGRQALARTIGSWLPATTTSAGNAGGTTVVASRFVGLGADAFRGYFLLLTSGTLSASGVTPVFGQVTDFDGTTGTFTVTPAFAGQVATSVTFELHTFSPELFTEAMNAAIAANRRYLFKPLYDSSITLTADDWEYTMPSGITSNMISRVVMEGSAEFDNIPDPMYEFKPPAVSYAQDDTKIWLNRGGGHGRFDVITDRKLYLIGRNYLTSFAKDTTYGALVTDTTAGAELTENTEAWRLFMMFAAAELYAAVASGPMVADAARVRTLAEMWQKKALDAAPYMRMREPDWNNVASL